MQFNGRNTLLGRADARPRTCPLATLACKAAHRTGAPSRPRSSLARLRPPSSRSAASPFGLRLLPPAPRSACVFRLRVGSPRSASSARSFFVVFGFFFGSPTARLRGRSAPLQHRRANACRLRWLGLRPALYPSLGYALLARRCPALPIGRAGERSRLKAPLFIGWRTEQPRHITACHT